MFDRILIANRGEIACRIMETCRKMGVQTVAVYSESDAQARHVHLADQAVCVGAPAPADSYLRGDVIIQAALDTGAQAIHPGYGFLSENPDFVDAVAAAGLVFIGPSADAIRAMGLKDAAKALMVEAGVPVVPGYHGADQNPDLLAAEAEKVGYPVLIKAVAGGGGKGMRLANTSDEFAEALSSAQAEARTAFGNDAVLIEKFVLSPRHIEVQVFGDGSDAVHLFERDCSLQRRHQKVIEEAPAPGMTEIMRTAMGDAAVKAAKAIGYAGAGTIEFIVDGSDGLHADKFWFMEMNTRLQVEHPVTEAITGVDLVEWQLRVASGEALPMAQSDLTITGHSFEARLYAEDVPKGFLPATGRLDHLSFPSDARADTGVVAGDVISPWYDPMIAKVIVHGRNRTQALKKLSNALADTHVAGTVTNVAFLKALADHAGFGRGDVDTGLIDRELDMLVAQPEMSPQLMAQAALITADLLGAHDPKTGFTLWAPLDRTIRFETGDVVIKSHSVDHHTIVVSDHAVDARLGRHGWTFDGERAVAFARHGAHVTLFDGIGQKLTMIDALDVDTSGGAGGNVIEAPMPGLVTQVAVKAGDAVSEGDRLVVLEAMKMEHVMRAPRDGVVATLAVSQDDQVEAGAMLVALEEEA